MKRNKPKNPPKCPTKHWQPDLWRSLKYVERVLTKLLPLFQARAAGAARRTAGPAAGGGAGAVAFGAAVGGDAKALEMKMSSFVSQRGEARAEEEKRRQAAHQQARVQRDYSEALWGWGGTFGVRSGFFFAFALGSEFSGGGPRGQWRGAKVSEDPPHDGGEFSAV